MDELTGGTGGSVRRGCLRHGTGGWEEFDGIGDAFSGSGSDEHAVAAVMVGSVAQVPSVLSVDGPRASCFWYLVYDHVRAQRCKWRAVEIEGAVEVRFCREAWIKAGGAKKVECQGGLWHDAIP